MHCLVSKPVSAKVMAGESTGMSGDMELRMTSEYSVTKAVVAVVHFLVAFVLVDNVWQEDAFHLLVNQVLNVAVH